ncbi:DinB family protein [Streptomyces sp. MI02-7b]|uniref:DinB family protein n=1 Tax=Streptomyces sp. MI02-7b TaxID=462941 RepID=UPI0029A0270D|nr:DinB family protein [Streptomyces sp. MI02-7b]MDX3076991.1 DinB family protein [Streptomyces sp. MI02-7b]
MAIDWGRAVVEQLGFYWDFHLRPRLEGLTDEEYFWEPVPDCWSLRPRGDGRWRLEGSEEPSRSGPFTTIAWRMTHVTVGVFESRYRAFFGGEGPTQWAPGERLLEAGVLPGSAEEAVAQLEQSRRRWYEAVALLDADALAAPLGVKGGPFAETAMGELIIHLNREVMHHGGEICLLRDLYRDGYRAAP